MLQTLSVDNQGSVPKNFGAGFASGASGISLRGLGAASTLVLLNGRRIAPFGLADDGQKVFADLNLIPLEAVERIEILKDGGSAIYGSDAIAGVVNVILRKDYQGLAVNASYGTTQYGNGQEKRASITGGFGDLQTQGFNVLANLEVGPPGRDLQPRHHRSRLHRQAGPALPRLQRQRDRRQHLGSAATARSRPTTPAAAARSTATSGTPPRSTTTTAATSRGVGFTRTFPGAACSNFTSHPQGDPGGGCLIDAAQEYGQIQPSQKYINFFTRGTLNIGCRRCRAMPSSTGTTTRRGVHDAVGGEQLGRLSGRPGQQRRRRARRPRIPTTRTSAREARLRYLAFDNGPRVRNGDSDFYRVLAGIKGTAGGVGLRQRVPLLGEPRARNRAPAICSATSRSRC